RLVHEFIVYDDKLMPDLKGKIVGVNALQNRLHVTRLEKQGSSFRTVEEEPFLMTSEDKRFRPVDVKSGPDGALYVADLYEPRINHVDPRDNWDKATGRIYRIRPKEDYSPPLQRDLAKKTSKELAALLGHHSRWARDTALRLLGDRKDREVIATLKENMKGDDARLALYSLWALYQVGGVDDDVLIEALGHEQAHVRRCAVRLAGDGGRPVSRTLENALAAAAGHGRRAPAWTGRSGDPEGGVALRLPVRPARAVAQLVGAGVQGRERPRHGRALLRAARPLESSDRGGGDPAAPDAALGDGGWQRQPACLCGPAARGP